MVIKELSIGEINLLWWAYNDSTSFSELSDHLRLSKLKTLIASVSKSKDHN